MFHELSILIFESPDLRDVWIAHCLTWDLHSQGDSPRHASESIREAIRLVVTSDIDQGLDPRDRSPAPLADWKAYVRTRIAGRAVALTNLGLLTTDRVQFAGTLYADLCEKPIEIAAQDGLGLGTEMLEVWLVQVYRDPQGAPGSTKADWA